MTLRDLTCGVCVRVLLLIAISSDCGLSVSCSSAPPVDRFEQASDEHPLVGCIPPTINQSSRVAGKMHPEVVKIVGRTSAEDGRRVKVLRGPDFKPSDWQPWPDDRVKFGSVCGPEAGAFKEIFDASRGDIDASMRSRPPSP